MWGNHEPKQIILHFYVLYVPIKSTPQTTGEILNLYLSGGHGDFVVQLSNNRLLYGKAFVEHVVEVRSNICLV